MTTTKEALEPQAAFTIRWCPVCGRDDRINSFKAAHYSRGELCRGVPITIEYSRVPAPIAPVVDDTEPLTDAQVDAWLEEHKNDPVDPAQANRVEWLFRKKLAASIVGKAQEWLRSYDERIAQGGKGAQDMERLYGEEAAFYREVIRAVETLALEPRRAAPASTVAPVEQSDEDHIADGAIGCRNCGDTWERSVSPDGTVAACEDCGDASYSLVTPELVKLRQAIGWICDATDAAYIEDSDNKRIHEIFNIAAQAAGLKRRLPDEHGRFDETIID